MKRKGFTLIELLFVICIIAILALFVVPSLIKIYNNFQKKAFIVEAKTVYKAVLYQIDLDNISKEAVGEYNSVNKTIAIKNEKVDYLITATQDKEINSFCVSNGKYKMIINNGTISSIKELEKEDYISIKDGEKLSCVTAILQAAEEDLLADIRVLALYIDTDADGSYTDEVDGGKVTSIPSGNPYFLDASNSSCTIGSIESWNSSSRSITLTGVTGKTNCNLYLKSGGSLRTLSTASLLGKYVTYIGNNGCLNCEGYGYTFASTNSMPVINKLSTSNDLNSWRIAYLDDNNIYIISTNPVFITYLDSSNPVQNLNNAAVKYCNPIYVQGGACQITYNATGANLNTWAISDTDFQQITLQNIGTLQTLATCYNKTTSACGYNNDLIQKPDYWFANKHSSTSIYLPYLNSSSAVVTSIGNVSYAYGLRPIIKLKSGITYRGGTGTSTNPYVLTP